MTKELKITFKCKKVGKCDRKHQCKWTNDCDGHSTPVITGPCLDDDTPKVCSDCNRFYHICPDLIMESE